MTKVAWTIVTVTVSIQKFNDLLLYSNKLKHIHDLFSQINVVTKVLTKILMIQMAFSGGKNSNVIHKHSQKEDKMLKIM